SGAAAPARRDWSRRTERRAKRTLDGYPTQYPPGTSGQHSCPGDAARRGRSCCWVAAVKLRI
ncbi:hypothetical protein, partial [Enterobacter hormaechei]|uniref:hypothetical protein n=1 Tax=Enterobacter hormaechei TaxID=158836 RepID=UPI003315886B